MRKIKFDHKQGQVSIFPDVSQALADGLLAMGGELGVAILLEAYSNGIFPWPHEGYPLLWFAPPKRAILEFSELYLSRRFARDLKKTKLIFTHNQNFAEVMQRCAVSPNRKNQSGTWITQEMLTAYAQFHQAGYAHSFEAHEGGQLVGGMYGIWIGKYFAGESMFFKKTNASKFVFIKTIEYLQNHGLTWLDAQVMSPLLKNFGAREMSRARFMKKLKASLPALAPHAPLF